MAKGWNKKGDEPTTCAICLEDVTSKGSSKKLSCGHMFHSTCLSLWMNSGNENAHCCVTCRKPWRVPVEPVLPKVIFLDHPPEWMWAAIVQGPDRAPRSMLADMDPANPPPLVFENFMAGGETLSIAMTMDMWEQMAEAR